MTLTHLRSPRLRRTIITLAAVAALPVSAASAGAGPESGGRCYDDSTGYGCNFSDGSGFHCDKDVTGALLGCITWSSDGTVYPDGAPAQPPRPGVTAPRG
jgi:hypothetical protein